MDFFELATMERGPKTVDPAMVNISLVLVSRSVYLIKISEGQPSNTRQRLVGDKLGEERIFARVIGGP